MPSFITDVVIFVVIDADCTGSCKSNYHTITTMTAPHMVTIAHLFAYSAPVIFWQRNVLRVEGNLIGWIYTWNVFSWKLHHFFLKHKRTLERFKKIKVEWYFFHWDGVLKKILLEFNAELKSFLGNWILRIEELRNA